MTAADTLAALDDRRAGPARELVDWLETGARPDDLFAAQVFADLSVPQWRVQAQGVEAVRRLRGVQHPYPGTVRVEALDRTSRGFLVQLEERWDAEGQRWYCRELIHCAVTRGRVTELTIYCTGDWDAATQRRHADQVRLLRP